jgi:hypothetical protein
MSSVCTYVLKYICMLIQNVPGGNINILEGHSICNSKQKIVDVHVSYSEWFPR